MGKIVCKATLVTRYSFTRYLNQKYDFYGRAPIYYYFCTPKNEKPRVTMIAEGGF
jgi:hypothetical protein